MSHWITVLPEKLRIEAEHGETLLSVLRTAGLILDAPCGGEGRCGKCRVFADGVEVLACRTPVDRDMTVTLPQRWDRHILSACSLLPEAQTREDCCLAIDLGTTTVAGYLLAKGKEPVCASLQNPQSAFGADVMSRIRLAVRGQQEILTNSIRRCLETLTLTLCREADISPGDIQRICVAGNPAMQQFLLGIPLDNLAKVPFSAVLTQVKTLPAKEILPLWENGEFLIVPDITGFVGADTVACMLAAEQDSREDMVLLVDIGTNAEMVLGNRRRRVACAAAAGPALAGAFGTYMNPKSACRMGLLPKELEGKITAVGNAALSGAILLACDAPAPERAQKIVETTETLELGTMPEFPRCFARNMRF